MTQTVETFAARYEEAFRAYLAGGADEAALDAAYELGRQAVAERLSLMDLAEVHHRALQAAGAEATPQAAAFFRESLATFELAARAFHDAQDTVRLEQEHATMQQALAEAAVAINENLDPRHILLTTVQRALAVLGAAHAAAEVRMAPKDDPIRAAHGDPPEAGGGAPQLAARLTGRGKQRIGSITLTFPPDATERPKERAVLQQLALMASSALENAQRYERERTVAETLQRSLLPPSLPDIPRMEAAAAYWAAGDGIQVGGDFYDVFRTATDDWAVVIGDVCGKGPHAAALTALTRYTARAAGLHERSPAAVLHLLNAAMIEQRTDGRFATVLCAFLRPGDGEVAMTTASGGHPLPLVLRADGRVDVVGVNGTLLGVIPEPALVDAQATLRAGDTLLLFTDGVIEVRELRKEVFGAADLVELLGTLRGRSPQAIIDAVHTEVSRRSGDTLRDDVALLALRVRE